jgi:hypothetical protein
MMGRGLAKSRLTMKPRAIRRDVDPARWRIRVSYSDFTLQSIEVKFGISSRLEALFDDSRPAEVPVWLRESLDRGAELPLVSEKARSELIVMPILLASRELSGGSISIFSGGRLDVLPEAGLVGECDFLLARTPPVPEVRSPLVVIVEAKKNDVESGLGQCVAQMIGARTLNERSGISGLTVFGCVTTGEIWQFLQLDGDVASIDRRRYYFDDVAGILGVFQTIIEESRNIEEKSSELTAAYPK